MTQIARFRQFVQSFAELVASTDNDEERVFRDGRTLLADLITHDDWLPEQFSIPSTERYQQYLLYCDPQERFSVTSFVWAPGQTTPVHNHTVWGMVGVMRGAELCEEFELDTGGGALHQADSHEVGPGAIDLVSPNIGDIHRVSNALNDRDSISIHVYGANIGGVKRSVYDESSGREKEFISGYSSEVIPNIWDRSAGS